MNSRPRALLLSCFLLTTCFAQTAPQSLAARAQAALSPVNGKLSVPGLTQPVRVLRGRWGVAHMYAQKQDDLFFALVIVAAAKTTDSGLVHRCEARPRDLTAPRS